MDEYIRVFLRLSQPPARIESSFREIPNDKPNKLRQDKGVPLVAALIEELRDISTKTGIPFD